MLVSQEASMADSAVETAEVIGGVVEALPLRVVAAAGAAFAKVFVGA